MIDQAEAARQTRQAGRQHDQSIRVHEILHDRLR